MVDSPSNREIARKLRHIAAAYLLKGENRFRIGAYEKAADAVEHANVEMKDIWEEGKLQQIPGIGASIASHLDEWFRTGKVEHFNQMMEDLPEAMFPLLDIPGFGPKRAYKLVTEFNLTSAETVIADLEHLAKAGKVALIEGFGQRSEKEILTRISDFKAGRAKTAGMVLPYADQLAQKILGYLRQNIHVKRAEPLGSLRRMAATVGDVDIAVASERASEVIDWFTNFKSVDRVLEKGSTTASILAAGGKQVDLMVQPPSRFGSLLQHFTGSKQHNIHLREYALKKGMSLSEYGIRRGKRAKLEEFSSERAFYQAVGLDYIAPELREDRGEIEAAEKRKLPKLVRGEDIKGDLHIHSNYNLEPSHDLGISSLSEIVKQARLMGYEYIGISDHNPSISRHSRDQIIDVMKRRKDYFEHIKYSTKSVRVQILIMLEIDILADGKLALPEEAFNYIDLAIASIHSSFNQSKKVMTQRVLCALGHPKVKIFGHPTGRLLLKRPGVEIDWDELFSFCLKQNKALEINSWPDRLDLPDNLVQQALQAGIKLVIGTDSHAVDQMSNMRFGVAVARRGWAEKNDILNTLPYNKFNEWLIGGR